MKIAICPGHHTDAQGARNAVHNISENEVAKKIVIMLKDLLEESPYNHDVSIIEGKLGHKVREINKGGFDLALDIHFNADAELEDTDNKKGYGCMVMHYPTSTTRKQQAAKMSSAIAESLGTKDRGARAAWYWGGSNPGTKPDYFTDKTNCPAFIPEAGYIDNNGFAGKYLVHNEGLNYVALALRAGIEAFNG